jgi:two-component system chemotaxis response regulator CheB
VRNLVNKIRLLARVDVPAHLLAMGRQNGTMAGSAPTVKKKCHTGGGIVAIAASTGGPQAIHTILSRLPGTFSAPIVITQHIAEGFTKGMVDWLNSGTPLTVRSACSGDLLVAGNVYVNPAEHSMRITEQGMVILGEREANQVYRPSCNTMLTSVAAAYRGRVIGLIMSGMGDDGVVGMQAIKKAGGTTLAQDSKSSVIYGMNRLAVERGCIDVVVPLADIPGELVQGVSGR